jgi:hypothetical protein
MAGSKRHASDRQLPPVAPEVLACEWQHVGK